MRPDSVTTAVVATALRAPGSRAVLALRHYLNLTHILDPGAGVRAVQESLAHASLSTQART